MQVCTSRQTDNHASTPLLNFFTGRMLFLPPNQQRQSTKGTAPKFEYKNKQFPRRDFPPPDFWSSLLHFIDSGQIPPRHFQTNGRPAAIPFTAAHNLHGTIYTRTNDMLSVSIEAGSAGLVGRQREKEA